MRHQTEPVHSEPAGSHTDTGRRDTHPAFGVAVIQRPSGTGRALFQSDLMHQQTITLTVHRADRTRDLNHDWVHPREALIEIEMSFAQWGSLVSSAGLGSGVPVTIRMTESEPYVPLIPYEPRIAESVAETKGAVSRLLARARETLAAVEEAVDQKKGVRALREALRLHHAAVHGAENNAVFAVRSLTDAAERVTGQAKSDIEAFILDASQRTGLPTPVVAPELSIAEQPQKTLEG